MFRLIVLDKWGHEETFIDPETGQSHTQMVDEREAAFKPLMTTLGDRWDDGITPLPHDRIVPELGLGMWQIWTPNADTVTKLYAECVDVLYCEEMT